MRSDDSYELLGTTLLLFFRKIYKSEESIYIYKKVEIFREKVES